MGSSNSLSGLGLSYGDLSGKKEPLDVCSSTFLLCFLLLNWTNNKVHASHWYKIPENVSYNLTIFGEFLAHCESAKWNLLHHAPRA